MRDVSDDQWEVLDTLIPKPNRRSDGRGRPWKSRRSALNGILWVLRTGAPWGTKIMAVADRNSLPVSICVESAAPHQVKLATSTLVQMVVPDPPQHLIGDNAYDSDKLDAQTQTLRH
jgi:hypothetical protein